MPRMAATDESRGRAVGRRGLRPHPHRGKLPAYVSSWSAKWRPRPPDTPRQIHRLSEGDTWAPPATIGRGFLVDAGKNQNILQQWPHWLGDLKVIEHTLEHHADLPDVSVLYGAVIPEPKVTLNRSATRT